jgi:hypothetical protein
MAIARPSVYKQCTLARALRYRNREVLLRFVDQYGVSEAEAEELFTETKKWLWLNTRADAPALVVTFEMKMLDEMWHNFALFTPDYAKYCQDCFGAYVHHVPTNSTEKQRARDDFRRDPDATAERRHRELAPQYENIYDKLGEDTLIKWQVELPLRFDRAFFLRAAGHSAPPPLGRKLRALLKQTLRQVGRPVRAERRGSRTTRAA